MSEGYTPVEPEELPDPILITKVDGTVKTVTAASRVSVMCELGLGADWAHIVGADHGRRRIQLAAHDGAGVPIVWALNRQRGGAGVLIPASAVMLDLSHTDAIYARVPAGSGMLTVISESID